MVEESGAFGLAALGVVGGLAILLYGVSLNAGESLNLVMTAGGVIVLAFVAVEATIVARL